MRETFSVAFYCRQSKAGKNGQAPIELSISINRDRIIIQLPRKMVPEDFNRDTSSRKYNDTKNFLDLYRQKADEAVQALVEADMEVNASNVRDYIKHGGFPTYRISDLKKEFMKYQETRIDNGITLGVFRKYNLTFNYVIKFFGDIAVEKISHADILRLHAAMLQDYTRQTAAGYMAKFKTIITYAYHDGKIEKHPFYSIRISKGAPTVEFLSDEEVETIVNHRFDIDRLERVKDMFLFSCFTGLSYTDVCSFNPSLIQDVNGVKIYQSERNKTHIKFTSVLLPGAIQILEKYGYNLPIISNQKMNSYLKEIQDLCRISKNLHFHLARKTYGHKLVNSGVPMSTISRCLGHSSTVITQKIYAIVDDSTVASEVASQVINCSIQIEPN